MKKTDLLFQMLEHPEQYSEAQWRDILADDECHELYTLMAKTKSATQATQVTDDEIDAEWQRLAHHKHLTATMIPLWRKIAAAAAIMIALFGFTYAAVRTGFFGVEKFLAPKETTHVEKKTTTKEQETKIEDVLTEEEQVEEERVPTDAELGIVEAKDGESNEGYSFPWAAIIIFGVLVIFFVICVIVVFANGGPISA